MYDLMIYSLKVGGCLAVFYLFFKLLLSRETFHRLNRVMVLAAMVLSFVLPLCVITIYREMPAQLEVTQRAGIPFDVTAEPEAFSWDRIVGAAFLLGAAATLCVTICSLVCVLRLVRRGRRERLPDGTVLVHADRPVTPFSWGRYIVISEPDIAENGGEIIVHEHAHLRLHHSWDMLVTDIAGCLQWFNPAMWLLRRELRAIHEYEADGAVLDSGVDAKHYQLLLVKKAAGRRWYSVANSFNHSKLKNRIAMMLQKRSSRWAGAKALLVLPLVSLALGVFAETIYVVLEDKGKKENIAAAVSVPEISVVGYRNETKIPAVKKNAVASDQGTTPAAKVEVPRDTSVFRISGNKEVQNGKQPIWVLDGKEIDESTIKNFDTNEIASVTVLKDASMKKLYPDRDFSDVILIISKKSEAEAAAAREVSDDEASTAREAANVAATAALEASSAAADKYKEGKGTAAGEPLKASAYSNGKIYKSNTYYNYPPGVTLRNGHFVCPKAALYFHNSKESTKEKLESIDPNTVRSVAVYKGDQAVKKYGEKGRGGVVVFKTRG